MALPSAGEAVCGGGGISSLPVPAATYLRGYRAGLGAPTRIALDASGNVYVTDPVKGQVVVRARNGRILSRTGGLGYPVGIAVDSTGRIYLGDGQAGSVTIYDANWQRLSAVGQGAGEFLLPNDVAVDTTTGNLYVADSKANLVKVYDSSGTLQGSFGGQGSGDAHFSFPTGIFVDAAAGEVLVVDQLNYRVQIFDLAGNFLFCFGKQGSGAGKFNVPQGIWVDAQRRIYVVDSYEGRIQVLDRNGNFIAFIGDYGDGPGRLRVPMDLLIDPFNRLFVASANNARLEVFGLDAFADPETVVPAVIHIEPNSLERTNPAAAVVAYIEVPGYPLDQIVLGSIDANGIATTATPAVAGDYDGNGVPDLRVEFDSAALLATLPPEGQGVVTVSGTLGNKQFEGSDVVQITVCGPGTVCSLGDADPQCNEAVCIAPIGCTVRPKADGTSCEDGNACTVADACTGGVCAGAPLNCDDGDVCTDDACDPVNGCVHLNNTAPCDDGSACTTADACTGGVCIGGATLSCDDANGCTDDVCDPASGCVHANNRAPCEDGDACTSGDVCDGGVCLASRPPNCDDSNVCTDDSCDPATGCAHTYNTAPCDDGDLGTVQDACDGAGRCAGQVLTGNYAVLRWPLIPPADVPLRLDWRARVQGTVCTDIIILDAFSRIDGDALALEPVDVAVMFDHATRVTGDVVTGGGLIRRLGEATVGGRVDTSGIAPELNDCFTASYRAATRWADWTALPASPGLAFGSIQVGRSASQRIPAVGTLDAGQIVIDATDIHLKSFARLTLVGGPATQQVVVRVRGTTAALLVGHAAAIDTDGLAPEQVIFVVDGRVTLRPRATVAGTVFATDRIRIGWRGRVLGALVGRTEVTLGAYATVEPHPFAGW